MNINSLRGGGCGASKKIQKKHEKEKQRGQQKVYKNDKKTMASSIQYHSESIFKNAIIAMSEKEKLMFSFQFFLDNRQELWGIIVNDEDGNQIVDVVLNNIKPLLEALKILIKGFVGYSVYLSQIISLLSWIVFCFYINTKNSDRFMKKEDQAKYLDAINEIKQEIEIEQNIGKYQNNLDYELYIIESIFTIVPTNNDELQEIAQSFLIGAATSFLSFSINDQFLDSLKRSVIYIYHEHDKACRKKMLKIIFALLQLKYEIVNKLQINTNPNSDHLERLNKVYQEVISQSSDWQIWCTWTKVLSQLFQQKLILPYKMIQILQISEQHFIHKNKIDLGQNQTEEICWLNLDSKLIESNSTAKLLYQNISQLQELGRLQYSILYGYQQIPSFETLYSSKLTQSMEKENYDAFQFNLSTISIMQHNAQEIKKAQLQFQQHIELLSITNKSKIQDINNNLSKAITNTIQLLEYIYSLHEIDNPKKNELESPKQSPLIQQSQYFQQSQVVNKSKDNKGDQKSEEVWFEEIVKLKKSQCKIFVSFFLKSIQKNSFQDKDIDKDNKDKEKEKDKEQDKDKDKEKDKIKDKEQDKEKIKNEATVEFGKDFIINERNQQGSDSIIQDQRYQLNILDILEEISKNRSKKKKKIMILKKQYKLTNRHHLKLSISNTCRQDQNIQKLKNLNIR